MPLDNTVTPLDATRAADEPLTTAPLAHVLVVKHHSYVEIVPPVAAVQFASSGGLLS